MQKDNQPSLHHLHVKLLCPCNCLKEVQEETLVLSSRGRKRFPSDDINCPITWRHFSSSNQCSVAD